jgi:hypothetical protein
MSTAAVVTDPQLQTEALTTVGQATALAVTNIESRTLAAELGRNIAGIYRRAEEWFAPMKSAAARAHKEICNKENEVLTPLKEAKQYLSAQIGAFDQAQERLRQAEERRLQEEARAQAAIEAQKRAEETAINDALVLEAQGDIKGAEAVLANPVPQEVYVQPVVIPRTVPKAAGVASVQNWKWRITDEKLIPREYLMVDEKSINGVVKSMKNKTNIPGIEVYPESAARFRA